MTEIEKYQRLLRRLRNDPRLWTETDDRVFNLIGKVLKRLFKLRQKTAKKVGPYSGLTKNELQTSRTCETDWF